VPSVHFGYPVSGVNMTLQTCLDVTMKSVQSLQQLWDFRATLLPTPSFHPSEISALPNGAQRYLTHAIAPGSTLASVVRLRMHGEIRLHGWHPFVAEQVISWNHGMIWQATVRMYGLSISGSDRVLDGQGAMQWKLFGMLPLVHASGLDITRSAAGRMNIESLWLPSVLSRTDVEWTAADRSHLHAHFRANGETAEVDYRVGEGGELQAASMLRWGNPDGGPFRYIPFGGVVEENRTFGGYTIPTRLRVGWYFGTQRFESEGEFFRATIDHAEFR
jgi:hypothetical protein